ncbi:protein kinase domain-containing protein [Micrococcus sp.]|uniref:protein kinase domain-containing protein n=1 Tax=Micrococcus sp. TaxID=1271 RepID=UPI002A910B49|nr:protein kinase [Micrococcus sp.]MDY6055577.1 protein kinase [Micrococcus sp.]
MSSTRRDPLVGDVVDGRYQVLARVARGGMSTVYRALDLRLDREVALKVMHEHLAEDPALVHRFEREAKTAARLSHPHVVAVLDQGHTVGPEGDVIAYLVMEFVPGRTLRAVLREQAPLSPARALRLLRPVLDGLAAAHRAGLVHRDVKPENVLVRDDGRVTVADFGLARAATGHTSAGQAVLGTPAYLAPEHILGEPSDARADVYAVGIMAFEMLTGRQPYTADTALQVAYRHVNERVPVPSTLTPGLPERIDDLVLWCTEPDPADRPADATVLLEAVDRLLAELGPVTNGADGANREDEAPTTVLPPVALTAALPTTRGAHAAVGPETGHETQPKTEPEPETEQAPAPSQRQARRAARRPALTLGAGRLRAFAIGLAVTLLLTGAALLLGWGLGSGGLTRAAAPPEGGAAAAPVLSDLRGAPAPR